MLTSPSVPSTSSSQTSHSRSLIYVTTVTTVVVLIVGAIAAMSVQWPWSSMVRIGAIALMIVPAAFVCHGVRSARFNLAWTIYWSWSFVFMGLAPAYQLAAGMFPWQGVFNSHIVGQAQLALLLGHCGVLIGYRLGRRGAGGWKAVSDGVGGSTATRPVSAARTTRFLNQLLIGYIFLGSTFCILMGKHLFAARADFRVQLLTIASLPFGGSLFFVATAGAIVIPAICIVCRANGLPASLTALVVATVVAAVVTNPLLGSRFLTGSFLVATVGALLCGKVASRLMPVLSIILLVVLFPTLDVLRGDGTGSTKVALVTPSQSLTRYDFDAFEMLLRETLVKDSDARALPSSVSLAVAPVVKWIPIVSRPFIGMASGSEVAKASGMQFLNVSMPLWGEGELLGGPIGVVAVLGLLGFWLGAVGRSNGPATIRRSGASLADAAALAPSAALMFIVLRGSLYEVFGYLALAVAVRWMLAARLRPADRRGAPGDEKNQ